MEWFVPAADGRTLAVEEAGDLDGRPVMVHVGTPNSRHLYGRTVADAAARGLRLISYDRPGYGDSTPQPGRTVADCAQDARVICAALGIGRLAMWGFSGGGPCVLACAALAPELVTAAASLCSSAPFDAEGLDWFAVPSMTSVCCSRTRRLHALTSRRNASTSWPPRRPSSPGNGGRGSHPAMTRGS